LILYSLDHNIHPFEDDSDLEDSSDNFENVVDYLADNLDTYLQLFADAYMNSGLALHYNWDLDFDTYLAYLYIDSDSLVDSNCSYGQIENFEVDAVVAYN
jgi:hypothetical protein